MSVMVLDQYGPTLGYEEEEWQGGGAKPTLVFDEKQHVEIAEDDKGSTRVSFRNTTQEDEDEEEIEPETNMDSNGSTKGQICDNSNNHAK